MSNIKLEQLFRRCEPGDTGYIDANAFRKLCHSFGIEVDDADAIFTDLDHDKDGRISYDDFSFGFRDFLTPGSRRGSIQLGLFQDSEDSTSIPLSRQSSLRTDKVVNERLLPVLEMPDEQQNVLEETERKQREMEINHNAAKDAWTHFVANIGKEELGKFLSASSDKLFTLYEELQQTCDASPHLVNQFESVISALVTDIKKIDETNKMMEDKIIRERESHTTHMKNMEEELDSQVAKIEKQAKEIAKKEHEFEKRDLQAKMESELAELQAQLKLFQKVDTWLNKEKDEKHSLEAQRRLDGAILENRSLKASLSDTKTSIALLKADLNQMRSQYDAKCNELHQEMETKIEYVYELDNMSRQLELLRDANQKLQDTNDGLQKMASMNSTKSQSTRRILGGSYMTLEGGVDEYPETNCLSQVLLRNNSKNGYWVSSDQGTFYDSDSLRSNVSEHSKNTDTNYSLKRLMNDLDSGNSTLHSDEQTNDNSSPNMDISRLDDISNVVPKCIEMPEYSHVSVPTEKKRKGGRSGSSFRKTEKDRDLIEIEVSDHSLPSSLPHIPPVPAPRQIKSQQRYSIMKDTNVAGVEAVDGYDLEATGQPERTYKVVFAGDAAVGKTSFINRITKGIFITDVSSTLGVDFQMKTFMVDGRNVALQLWDTAGQERFRSITKSYFRRADGVMLLYDVNSEKSFLSVRNWIESVDDASEKRVPIMLCGNKADLRKSAINGSKKFVLSEDGEKVARNHQAIFLETSAKDGQNVIQALIQLIRNMYANEDLEIQTSVLNLRANDKKKSCC